MFDPTLIESLNRIAKKQQQWELKSMFQTTIPNETLNMPKKNFLFEPSSFEKFPYFVGQIIQI